MYSFVVTQGTPQWYAGNHNSPLTYMYMYMYPGLRFLPQNVPSFPKCQCCSRDRIVRDRDQGPRPEGPRPRPTHRDQDRDHKGPRPRPA